MPKKLSPEMERALQLSRKLGRWHYPATVYASTATLEALVRRGLMDKRWGDFDIEYRAKGD